MLIEAGDFLGGGEVVGFWFGLAGVTDDDNYVWRCQVVEAWVVALFGQETPYL